MGRGRAKAKQTKVARDLKYRTWEPDLDQLKRELSGQNGDHEGSSRDTEDRDENDDADDSGQYRS
jgi:Protein of unknown function (DUF3073)